MQQDHGKSSTPVGRKCRAQIVCGALPIRNRKNKVQTSNDATPLTLGRWIVLFNTLVMLQHARVRSGPASSLWHMLQWWLWQGDFQKKSIRIRRSNVENLRDFNLHWGKHQKSLIFVCYQWLFLTWNQHILDWTASPHGVCYLPSSSVKLKWPGQTKTHSPEASNTAWMHFQSK